MEKKVEKKKKILAIVGGLALLLGIYFTFEYLMYVTTDNAQVEAHALMVAPRVAGYITQVRVTEGQRVAKGDILIEIDERDYQNSLRQLKGELTSIEANERDAEKNFKRLAGLYSKGAVSQQQYDQVSTAYSGLKAKFESISAQVAQAQLNLDNTKLKAPSEGFIAKKSAEPGQLAAPGVPLLGFVDAQERWITANFKETDLSSIKIGATVRIKVDAVSSRTFSGEVTNVSAATGSTFTLLPPDNATGNFTKVVQRVPVRISLKDVTPAEIELLRAGLSADVRVSKH